MIGGPKLKPWVEDIAEQIALGTLLHRSSEPSVRRVAWIVIDNAIEVALKSYVQWEAGLQAFGLKVKQWETDYRDSFFKLVELIWSKRQLTVDKQLVMNYHATRNTLYHDPKMLAVDAKDIGSFISDAKTIVDELFGVRLAENQWAAIAHQLVEGTFPRAPIARTRVIARDGLVVKVEGLPPLSHEEAAAVSIQRLLETEGEAVDNGRLTAVLSASGKPPSNLRATLRQMRATGLLKKDELVLTSRGHAKFAHLLVPETL